MADTPKSPMTQLFNQVRENCAVQKDVLLDMSLTGPAVDTASLQRILEIDCSKAKPAPGQTLEQAQATGDQLKAVKQQLKQIDHRRAY